MQELRTWLDAVAAEPLPGGVSAAALAAAMGAALVAKVTRVTLRRQDAAEKNRAALQAVLDLADRQRDLLVDLAHEDELAYRAMLGGLDQGEGNRTADPAWHRAIEVPIRVAEACHGLLERLPGLVALCWPAVETDLHVGQWLLEVGLRAGLPAAESNLQVNSEDRQVASLRTRVEVLSGTPSPGQPPGW
jgi:formiminotetrahydrofolate cyclodeaminase